MPQDAGQPVKGRANDSVRAIAQSGLIIIVVVLSSRVINLTEPELCHRDVSLTESLAARAAAGCSVSAGAARPGRRPQSESCHDHDGLNLKL